MKWLHLLNLLLFSLLTTQVAHAQASCTPDPDLANNVTGLYPEPFHPTLNVNGGITEIAYNDKEYEFIFTLVLEDTITDGSNVIILDRIELEAVNGLPNGLFAFPNPTSGVFQENSSSCLRIGGTPNDVAGVYDIEIRGRVFFGGSQAPIAFPDDGRFPNQRYLLTLEEECPVDLCDGFNVTVAMQQGVSCGGTCDGTGSVNIVGGTAPFTYDWSNGAVSTGPTATGLCAESYRVTVTDSNGCRDGINVHVPNASGTGFTVDLASTDADCTGGNGTATATPSGGMTPFTYAWSSGGATGSSLTNIAAGNYTVTVTDGSGCMTIESIMVGSSAGVMASLASSSDVSCNGLADGTATVSATGGTGLSYAWSGSASGTTGASATGLNAGNYTVTVMDNTACMTMVSVTINEPPALGVTLTKVDADCTSGSASSMVTGGTTPYTYLWSNSQASPSISGLSGGMYTLTVTDANNCTMIESVIVNQPATGLSASASVTSTISCNGANDGAAMATAAGGGGGYNYAWSTGNTNASVSGLSAGIHTVTVTDAANCETVATVNMNEPAIINLSASATDVSCDGDTNGSVSVSASGGSGGFSYNWSSGGTTATVNNLAATTYTVTVTDSDGCMQIATASIEEPAPLSAIISKEDVSCDGTSLGMATAMVTGGTGNYNYNWSTGSGSVSVNGLSGGTYQLTVTDASGCMVSQSVTINAVAVPLQATISSSTNVSCNGAADGTASVMASGGTGGYTYQWSNALTTTSSINGLSGGTYRVTINDSGDCEVIETVVINEPSNVTISSSTSDVSCGGQMDGMISLNTSGGAGGYSYAWDNGLPSNASQSGLTTGVYRVTVTDSDGCSNTSAITIDEPLLVGITTTTTDVECAGESTGSAIINLSGGTSPFSYDWSNSLSGTQSNTLSAGMYTVTVTDANNCVGEVSFTINQPTSLNANTSATAEVTLGDGRAEANPSGGTPPYNYRWSNGSSLRVISNLAPDFYMVTVTDASGCTTMETVTVSASGCAGLVTITIDEVGISCPGNSDATLTAIATGGASPYTYQWSNGEGTSMITDLDSGPQTVTVTDANGCPATANVTINQVPVILPEIFSQTDISCANDIDGAVRVQARGGTRPYTYAWSNGASGDQLDNIAGGAYFYTITDTNGCTAISNVTILEPAELVVDNLTFNTISCSGVNDGSATIEVEGGTNPYSYLWSNGGTTTSQNNLSADTYTVTITDARGCSIDTMLTINAIDGLELDIISQANVSCNGGNDGAAMLEATGGTGTFTYNWSNSITGSSANDLEEGTYRITATDGNNCSRIISLTIEQPFVLMAFTSATNQSAAGINDGSVTANPSGGTPPYTYSWDTPNSDITATALGLLPGTYTVTVTDANNCTITESVTIGSVDCSLSATINSTDVLCNGEATGSASVEVTGNSEVLSYLWSDGSTLASISNVAAGTYTVVITEENGCSTMATTIINELPLLRTTIVDSGDIACGGSMNGFAEIEIGGGAGDYNVLWSNSSIETRIDNLAVGEYTVTVNDINGCSATTSIQINETEGLNLSIGAVQNASCEGEANGAATIEPNGGTEPYTYIWSNGNTTPTATELAAGIYSATVNDINGCSNEIELLIGQPSNLDASISTPTSSLCNGALGTATAMAAGGTAPYSYLWSTGTTDIMATDLDAGTYSVIVTDANNCTIQASITLETGASLSLTLSASNASNINASDGSASVGVQGGTMPFTYVWANALGNTIGSNSMMSELAPGEYTVMVSDANGCSAMDTVLIEEEGCSGFNLMLDIAQPSCGGTTLGSLNAVLSNATEPITYEWSSDASTASINNLNAGTYTVTVTDGNACSSTASATLEVSNGFDVALQEMTPMTCQSIANGTARLETTGGVAPYTFLWPVQGDSTNHRTNLVSGFYNVTIFDAAGCTNTITFSVERTTDTEPPTVITQTAAIYLDEFGNASLSVAEVDGGTIDDCGIEAMSINQTTFSCDDLGTTVSVDLSAEDKSGNTATQSAQVMVLDTMPPIIICPNDILLQQCEAENSVEFPLPNAFDNCGEDLTPTLMDGRPNGASFPLGENMQVFSVSDASGNSATCSFLVIVQTFDVTEITVNEPTCFNFPNGSATVSVTGARPPLTFNWSNGATDSTAINLIAGAYSVTVEDGNNCTYIESINIEQPPLLRVNLDIVTGEISEEGTGLIAISVEGGRAPYLYRWLLDGEEVSTEQGITNANSGVYRVQVTDANGCSTISEDISVVLTSTDDWLEATAVRLMPNPTSGLIQLDIDLPQANAYTANLYDLNGRLLRTLAQSEGQHKQHQFDLSAYSSGVYFVRIQVENSVLTKRVVLMKD